MGSSVGHVGLGDDISLLGGPSPSRCRLPSFTSALASSSSPVVRGGDARASSLLSKTPTSFHKCLKILPRGFRDSLGLPCRSDEEESCNEVHATCAYVPRTSLKDRGKKAAVGPPCGIRGRDNCNARAVGYPWGLDNPEASKALTKRLNGDYHEEVRKPVVVPAPWTIWGMAVHGKSGTWAFDSGGRHAYEYVYEVPQGGYAPSDYYLCDSREHPQHCGLLGGNLVRGCAEYYDPISCPYCEDNGTTLTCQVRGWDPRSGTWAKVPIYPRDLLGELYRGEWRDMYAKPSWASVTLRKADLLNVKKLPKGLITKGPSKSVATLKYADATEVPGGVGFHAIMAFNKLIAKGVASAVGAFIDTADQGPQTTLKASRVKAHQLAEPAALVKIPVSDSRASFL